MHPAVSTNERLPTSCPIGASASWSHHFLSECSGSRIMHPCKACCHAPSGTLQCEMLVLLHRGSYCTPNIKLMSLFVLCNTLIPQPGSGYLHAFQAALASEQALGHKTGSRGSGILRVQLEVSSHFGSQARHLYSMIGSWPDCSG